MTGKIIKGIAGFYYVRVAESAVYSCKAKGIFRKAGIKPLVGDDAEIEITHEADKEGNIIRILPRRNELFRPAAANIDQALLVFALEDPKPNEGVLDRFLLQLERQKIPSILCFNKQDLDSDGDAAYWEEIYRPAGYPVVVCSVKTGEGIETVRELLAGKTTAVAGPSGVGKSSLINLLAPDANMETGQTSKKLGRGKHTTRHSELFGAGDNTYILDTPGFTSFENAGIEKEDLETLFPEFLTHREQCRFVGCAHVNEPDCAVKEAVEKGQIHPERYRSYVQLYEELKEAEKRRY